MVTGETLQLISLERSYHTVVFVKDSVLVLFTDKAVSAKRDPSALAREGLLKANRLWFQVIQWLQVAYSGIIQITCSGVPEYLKATV